MIVPVRLDESAVQFDGDFFGGEVELTDQLPEGRTWFDIARLAVHFDRHGDNVTRDASGASRCASPGGRI